MSWDQALDRLAAAHADLRRGGLIAPIDPDREVQPWQNHDIASFVEGRFLTGWHHQVSVLLCCFAFVVRRTRPRLSPVGTRLSRSATQPERHFGDSFVTVRIAIARYLVRSLSPLPSLPPPSRWLTI
jgi:hypothetical protein